MPAKIAPPSLNQDAAFTENSFYERLIDLRRKQPEVFAALSPTARLTLGYYEAAKRQAALIFDGSITN